MRRWLCVVISLIYLFGSTLQVFGSSGMEQNMLQTFGKTRELFLTEGTVSQEVQEVLPVTIKESELFSQGAVLMDAASGRVLFGKNPDLQLAMASTTKIMTCIVALELGDLEETVTASGYAAGQPKVKLYLNKGDQVLLKDLLYSLMLESHNDSAVAIAEHIGVKLLGLENDGESVCNRTDKESKEAVGAFISCMNEKAGELQCYNTWFITPNGLDGTETFYSEEGVEEERFHSTTAAELARIMSYCILQSPKSQEFLDITGTYSYSFTNLERTRSFSCQNHNAFLNMMDGAISGKTGYTGRAGYCYVGALKQDERYFVVALLNSGAYGSGNKGNKWKDTRKLMNYGLEYFKVQKVYEGGISTDPVQVQEGRGKPEEYFESLRLPTKIAGEEPVSILMAEWERAEVLMEQQSVINAPVRVNQPIGKVEVYLNGVLLKHFDIVVLKAAEKKGFRDALDYIVYQFLMGTK